MKEIKAYIHNHRIADVISALKESGLCSTDGTPNCHNLAVVPAKILLKAMDTQEQHYSIELAEAVINESKLELVCEDHQVDCSGLIKTDTSIGSLFTWRGNTNEQATQTLRTRI